ncbi:MFS transporter [Apibacter muscae]|uniref:Alpha-ketoglutarate permease n=1 Tax=Apibacter muscae TaxID=2509004 RepID=A0A563DBI5_9FLAO|nr:MFS family transporter [Apibacter muscae]TWP27472.1 MFS transporter [Apibacter muscae]
MGNDLTKKNSYTKDQKRKSIVAILSASSGNLVEWFDFYVYAFTSIYFAHLFFPEGDTTSKLLKTAGVFAAGFLMRPIGGWIFGRIADKHGRKKSMVTSILMMAFGSLLIACLPTYSSIGVFAPLLLLIARLIQGLSVGGEYGATATYMSEVALPNKRGFYSSFQYVTLIGGQLLAALAILILESTVSENDMKTWAWRIPFFLGAIAALVSLYLRKHLKETAPKKSVENKKAGSLVELFKNHTPAFLTVLGYTSGGSLIFYTFSTYMQKYLVNTAGFETKTATQIMTACLFIFMIVQPIFGSISDKIGRRTCMMLFGGLGALITCPVIFGLTQINLNPFFAFLLISLALCVTSFYTSIGGIVKAEMFPPEIRALGVGLSYAIANAIFGGSAEFVALSFKDINMESGFYIYVTVMLIITFLVSTRLPKKATYLNDNH